MNGGRGMMTGILYFIAKYWIILRLTIAVWKQYSTELDIRRIKASFYDFRGTTDFQVTIFYGKPLEVGSGAHMTEMVEWQGLVAAVIARWQNKPLPRSDQTVRKYLQMLGYKQEA